MSYAIIGFGNLGWALAKAFARSGIEVSVATTRGIGYGDPASVFPRNARLSFEEAGRWA